MELADSVLSVIEQKELQQHETVIERGLKTFYEVGTALLAIRDKRLYRVEYKTFEDYCQKRWNMDRHYAHRVIDAAQVAENLLPIGNIPNNEAQARPLTELEPSQQRIVWEVVRQTAPAGKVTAAHVKSVVNVFKEVVVTHALDDGTGEQIHVSEILDAVITEETYERMMRQKTHIAENGHKGTPIMQSSEGIEYYTPPYYLGAARRVMGVIDLDPASCEAANKVVRAATFYTLKNDGLKQQWWGNVWLNPPYGWAQSEFAARLLEFYSAGDVQQAILLVNANVTETKWFAPFWDYTVCFTDHRINFLNTDDKSGSTHGSCFVYLGPKEREFIQEFKQFGVVVKRVDK